MLRALSLLFICAVVAACSATPDVDAAFGAEPADGPYPELMPLGDILAKADAMPRDDGAEATNPTP
jgi:hypothetical protein